MVLGYPSKLIRRDYKIITGHAKVLFYLKVLDSKKATVGSVFDGFANKSPDKVCFYYEDQKWTFKQVKESSNQVGHYFSKVGYKRDDVISLLMENCPQFVITWLGLSKIGVVTSLINYNLRSTSLKHCLETSKSKAIVCGYDLTSAIRDIYPNESSTSMELYSYGEKELTNSDSVQPAGFQDINPLLHTACKDDIPSSAHDLNFRRPMVYCFTSGTTGFPKPAYITHSRYFMAAYGNHYASDFKDNDIIYMSLPLYHVAGGMLGLSQTLVFGTSMVISKRFSPKNFWKDCIKYKATAAQYIAETCRFILRTEPSSADTEHSVRIIFGNGFRKDIWTEFVNRFKISTVTEFYASTEGNANLLNNENVAGAVGMIPIWLESRYPIALVKINEETGELIRDPKTGYVLRCSPMEKGELIGKVVQNSPLRDFKGYTDKKETEKKLIRDVFQKGDLYFRTGDLLEKDEQGFLFFVDRMGDTFRWKSENVSTAEVESVITRLTNFNDVVAYGVTVPGYDGKAGMATVADPEGTVDISKLHEGIIKTLPHYARPLFIRIKKEIETTGTHKLKKTDLAKEGYDLTKIPSSERVYIYLHSKNQYTIFTPELQNQLIAEKLKL